MFFKLLQISISVIGWLLSYIAVFFIPLIEISTCTMGGDDAWLISLIFYTPFSLFSMLLIIVGCKYRFYTKWLSLPHILLIPLALFVSLKYLWGSTILGNHVCHVGKGYFEHLQIEWWHRTWAPIKLTEVTGFICLAFYSWDISVSVLRQRRTSLFSGAQGQKTH